MTTKEDEELLKHWFQLHAEHEKVHDERIACQLETARLQALEENLLEHLQEFGRKHSIVLTKAFSAFVNKESEKS